jgi:hypothetical protein
LGPIPAVGVKINGRLFDRRFEKSNVCADSGADANALITTAAGASERRDRMRIGLG